MTQSKVGILLLCMRQLLVVAVGHVTDWVDACSGNVAEHALNIIDAFVFLSLLAALKGVTTTTTIQLDWPYYQAITHTSTQPYKCVTWAATPVNRWPKYISGFAVEICCAPQLPNCSWLIGPAVNILTPARWECQTTFSRNMQKSDRLSKRCWSNDWHCFRVLVTSFRICFHSPYGFPFFCWLCGLFASFATNGLLEFRFAVTFRVFSETVPLMI